MEEFNAQTGRHHSTKQPGMVLVTQAYEIQLHGLIYSISSVVDVPPTRLPAAWMTL